MTVKELKELLNKYDDNLSVVVDYEGELLYLRANEVAEIEGHIEYNGKEEKLLRIVDVDGWLCR